MSPLDTVKAFYVALGRGDVAAVIALLDTPLEWTEAEGFPYHAGTWRSPQAIVDGLFVPLARDWDDFSARAESFVSEGGEVVAFGTYGGTNRTTGRILDARFAHLWRVADGRINRFVQYTDTALVQAATRV
ncbi:nuclear transport factor 2 family protein [uncultured Brevundimonas sp.]|uniref:nuclear transport factor 2 family protein n=1 Tax=uncultured Brevundimonas sp. TaxID=213418 RepID=UPI0030EDA259|tara:strand:+ start:6304 stop:6696 length:393 start_codon:yes stop_codon:yes gene_type:complete